MNGGGYCSNCGRFGTRGFIPFGDTGVMCANESACDRRKKDQSPSAKLRRIEAMASRNEYHTGHAGYLSRRIIAILEGRL